MSKDLIGNDDLAGRWNAFLEAITSGKKLEDAMLQCRLTQAELNAVTIADSNQHQRWLDACTAAHRASYSALNVQEIMRRFAQGKGLDDAVLEVMGEPDPNFAQLITQDSGLNAMFNKALEARTLTMPERLLQIVDDKSGDVLLTDKGPIPNNAAVSRSKLQAETRRGLMGAWNPMYREGRGPVVQVNNNFNLAERLEGARTRERLRGAKPVTPKQIEDAIDATFSAGTNTPPDEPAPVAAETRLPGKPPSCTGLAAQWVDSEEPAESAAVPLATIWREED
jgi:hypothetical protein